MYHCILRITLVSLFAIHPFHKADAEDKFKFSRVEYNWNTGEMTLLFYVPPSNPEIADLNPKIEIVQMPDGATKLLRGAWLDMSDLSLCSSDERSARVLGYNNSDRQRIEEVTTQLHDRFEKFAWQLRNEELSAQESRKATNELAEFMQESFLQLTDETQRERIRTLAFALEVNGSGMIAGLATKRARERLSISEKQVKEMRKLLPEVDNKLKEEILKLVHEYREQLLKEGLTESQLEKLNELRGTLVEDSHLPFKESLSTMLRSMFDIK